MFLIRLLRGKLLAMLLVPVSLLLAGCEHYHGSVEGVVITGPLSGVRNPVKDDESLSWASKPMAGVLVEVKSLRDGSKRLTRTDCMGRYAVEDVRYGPNDINLYVGSSQDVTDDSGQMLCKATATYGYVPQRRYFVDVRKDETSVINVVMIRQDVTRTTGLSIIVESDTDGNPIQGARVDLYAGSGPQYRLVDTKSTSQIGVAEFFKAADNRIDTPGIGIYQEPMFNGGRPGLDPLYVTENTIQTFRAEVSAYGYANMTRTFYVTYADPVPTIETIRLMVP